MKHCIYTAIVLALSLIIVSCDNSTSTKESSSSHTPTTEAPCSFAFATEEHRIAHTENEYTHKVAEGNTCVMAYSSSNPKIATVDNKGTVTFKTPGTVVITASKENVSDKYTLYITMKPQRKRVGRDTDSGKEKLKKEIKRAMNEHGYDVDLNYIDTDDISDMSYLFEDTRFKGDISKWNVSKVTTMIYMFKDATKFNSDISKWDVSNVITMNGMFWHATEFNRDISKWDVSNVTDMKNMFSRASKFNQDLNAWGSKINTRIKEGNWALTRSMFLNSGLAHKLPTWCETQPECKRTQR